MSATYELLELTESSQESDSMNLSGSWSFRAFAHRKGMRLNSHAALLSTVIMAIVATIGCNHAGNVNVRQSLKNNLHTPTGGPELLAVYQPWFGNREHIDVGYSTLDRVVLERQIEEAKNLGIAGFVVNWYGRRKSFTDQSYALLQQAANESNFQVAIQYDEAIDNPGEETEAVIADLKYAYERYIGPQSQIPSTSYLRYDGRPVIFIFPKTGKTDWNRVRQMTDSWAQKPVLLYKDVSQQWAGDFDGFYAWVEPGRGGWKSNGSNWGESYLENFYGTMKNRYPDKLAVGAAWPGFDDSKASWTLHRFMNARCGKTFDDTLHLYRRYYNDTDPLPYLLIVTWNDYEEGTAIERGVSCAQEGARQTAEAR
jgi:hypothetical protein